jgi:hypothetical protein
MATRAVNEQPKGGNFNQAIDLLERNEMRDFDAIFFQFWIQQHSTGAAMNHVRRHVFTAFRTRSPWPSGHNTFSFFRRGKVRLVTLNKNPFNRSVVTKSNVYETATTEPPRISDVHTRQLGRTKPSRHTRITLNFCHTSLQRRTCRRQLSSGKCYQAYPLATEDSLDDVHSGDNV